MPPPETSMSRLALRALMEADASTKPRSPAAHQLPSTYKGWEIPLLLTAVNRQKTREGQHQHLERLCCQVPPGHRFSHMQVLTGDSRSHSHRQSDANQPRHVMTQGMMFDRCGTCAVWMAGMCRAYPYSHSWASITRWHHDSPLWEDCQCSSDDMVLCAICQCVL